MRTIGLRKDVHSEKVKVSFKNGILEVRLLKTEEEGQGSQSQNRLTRGRVLGGNNSRGGEDVHSDADTAG
jgi:hypothetical protein